MARFEPKPSQDVCFHVDGNDRWFSAVVHPRVPSMVHSMEGGKAFVYRLRDLQDSGAEYALKVMKPRHRDPGLGDVCAFLDRLKDRPGLTVCERLCLSPDRAAKTLGEYPELQYAILMPWISGESWFDLLQSRRDLAREECLALATNLADALAGLEAEGMSHCDLSSGNLLFDRGALEIELIDVEDLFSPGGPPPKALPAGTPGYQHRTSAQGQWSREADRFAGAVLLSEILGWYDPGVRATSYGESFFDPAELQQDGRPRFAVLSAAVRHQRPKLGDFLEQAWRSRTLGECPPLSQWAQACRNVTWKPLRPVPAPPRPSVKPFWKPISPGASQGPGVRWKQGMPTPASVGNPVTWKGGTGGGP